MIDSINFFIDGKQFTSELLDKDHFTVRSVPRSYQVSWEETDKPIERINQILSINKKNLLVIDERMVELYGDQLQIEPDRIFSAPATEHFKTLDGVTAIFDFLHQI
ncbi:MAG TPA: hypothetical protein VJL60_02325, partial [Gammaproteobacteria bacterium]|nr:hypothetical protein [Gammaproteobacteria bacterium]